MKKLLCVLLCAVMLFAAVPMSAEVAADYILPGETGINNVFLSYTFCTPTPSSGHRTKEGYAPLVGYYNTDGELTDSFFDTFLFLPCVTSTPSGGMTYKSESNPNNLADWKAFIDDCFANGYNIPALNAAVGEFKAAMGAEWADYKAGVFLSVLYPVATQTNFGDFDNDGVSESFADNQTRIDAVKWMIDTQLSRFSSGDYENLNLKGFYWFEESISSNASELALVNSFNSYLDTKDLLGLWIPYFKATGYLRWRDFGFDIASMQPNYMFNANADASRVDEACNIARDNGMSIEIESSGDVFSSVDYYNRYLMYLKKCVEKGADKSIKTYYNDAVNGVYYNAYASDRARHRAIYDLTYLFAKEKLDPDSITPVNFENFRLADFNIASIGASYTATTPYTNTTADYGDVDNKELTDGVLGNSSMGSEWHAFHVSNKDDGKYVVTLDLGSVKSGLDFFAAELGNSPSAGVGLPAEVRFYTSVDGVNYTDLGAAVITDNNGDYANEVAMIKLQAQISARYVKAVFTPGAKNFVFVSEVMAGSYGLKSESGYRSAAQGKSYTASSPYTDSALGYAQISGKELTDGIYGNSEFGSEWHAFHKSLQEQSGGYAVTVDLGENTSALTRFSIQFEQHTGASVNLPSAVTFSASQDGVTFTQIGSAVPLYDGKYHTASFNSSSCVSARYVRAEFDIGAANFVFASEFYIGQNLSALNTLDPTFDPESAYYDKIREKTTVSAFAASLSGAAEVRGANGNLLSGSDYITTGSVITSAGKSFTVIVYGDVNGDGKVSAPDYIIIKRSFIGSGTLDGVKALAADVDGKNGVGVFDYLKLKRYFLKLFDIYAERGK